MWSFAATVAQRGSGAWPSRPAAWVAISRLRRATALVYASSFTPIRPSATDTTLRMWYRSPVESYFARLTQKSAVAPITGNPVRASQLESPVAR